MTKTDSIENKAKKLAKETSDRIEKAGKEMQAGANLLKADVENKKNAAEAKAAEGAEKASVAMKATADKADKALAKAADKEKQLTKEVSAGF